jgi:hypothetical protein
MKGLTLIGGKTGFLGIAFNVEFEQHGTRPDQMRPVITVMEMLPGFPSAEYLKIGDRIVGIEGTEFPADFTTDDFRQFVASKKPGTKLTLMLIRGKEQINVSMRLAGLKDVDDMSLSRFKEERLNEAELYLTGLKKNAEKPVLIGPEARQEWGSDRDNPLIEGQIHVTTK